tara:strand:+ start:3871 stop:4647 length:777 start_codon:yes stop_codon:yes gene_type:complete
MEKTKEKLSTKLEKNWEIKDRYYYVLGSHQPLTMRIPSQHSRKYPLLWFDEDSGKQRELRYATNMNSCFKDEQEGEATMGHIMFKDGSLTVPKRYQALQKLLSLYHPLKGKRYDEIDEVAEAADELDHMQLEIEALNAATNMDIDMAEAILRTEQGTKVSKLTSKELKRDLLVFAKRNPALLLDLAQDENVQLRNFAIKAVEARIIKLADDQRTFKWASNGAKLMTVPFDEHPFSAMAAFFKTDEGLEVYKSIEKKFK